MPNGRRVGSCGRFFISANMGTNRHPMGSAARGASTPREREPLQNQVTPFGNVVAIPQRGLYTGNRGIIHDPATKTLLGRRWTTKAWLVCVLDYKGRRRELMGGRSWTELFFLDEAVALAAGHRPASSAGAPKLKHFKPPGARRREGRRLWRRRSMRYCIRSGWTEAANGSTPSLILLQSCRTAPW